VKTGLIEVDLRPIPVLGLRSHHLFERRIQR